jgi:mono/diheme cytochrome c family protein
MHRIAASAGLTVLLLAGLRLAAEDKKEPAAAAHLGKEVAALFQARCVKCHGVEQPKAKLDLTSMEGLSRGSKRGPVVIAGKPADSSLWHAIQEEKMPPKQPLPEAERALLHRWIEQGAPGLKAAAKVHWAFQPPLRPTVPTVKHGDRVRTDVDRFVAAVLEKKGLTLSPEADRLTLIRRVSFDLVGLPPTLAEIDVWLNDKSVDAYERMVDRYLASPHYGERWGKYWLDTAGYADSNGYFSADTDRPLAWRYRDYVIRAFNQDKPYDQFVREQLAGDELAGFVPGGDVTPDMAESLVATHFLRNAPDGTGESDGNPDEVRTDRFTVLEGSLQVTMNSLLGITIQCARCHEHKFEPISHEEYYKLQTILFPAYCPDRWKAPKDRVISIGSKAERDNHQRRTERIDRQVKALETSLAALAGPFEEQLIEERLAGLEAGERVAVLQAVATPKEKRTKEQQALLKKHVEPLKIGDEDLAKRFPEYAPARDVLKKAIAERQKEKPAPLETLSVFVETDAKPPPHHLLLRGQHNAPGKEVEPGVPLAFATAKNSYELPAKPAGQVSSGRRAAFARWVTSPENPLFARVMVNRIWQRHFGVGIVATPDNLGQSGAAPSHPELLDYLATEFARSGWSIKAVHRLILNSAVYRQVSSNPQSIDPDNRLLARYPLRRLDAEAIRDTMLAVSGELDPRAGGKYVPTKRTDRGGVEVDEKHEGARRRSVYLQQRRSQVTTFLELFDAPAIVNTCSNRTVSTVPLQSLALLNSGFARTRAAAFARRLHNEAGPEADKRVALAFQLACGRQPSDKEREAVRRFLATQQELYAADKNSEQKVWTDFAQMVLASNAFLYVE